MAIKEDKSFTGTQIGYRSLLLEKGHGVSVSTARCLSKVLNCFIQLSKNTKEENRLSYVLFNFYVLNECFLVNTLLKAILPCKYSVFRLVVYIVSCFLCPPC